MTVENTLRNNVLPIVWCSQSDDHLDPKKKKKKPYIYAKYESFKI
jgi:hypothetical protein